MVLLLVDRLGVHLAEKKVNSSVAQMVFVLVDSTGTKLAVLTVYLSAVNLVEQWEWLSV